MIAINKEQSESTYAPFSRARVRRTLLDRETMGRSASATDRAGRSPARDRGHRSLQATRTVPPGCWPGSEVRLRSTRGVAGPNGPATLPRTGSRPRRLKARCAAARRRRRATGGTLGRAGLGPGLTSCREGQVLDIPRRAGLQVIDADDAVPAGEQVRRTGATLERLRRR
jgi:hypothetical protein